jgi:hypothetical protein
MRNRSYARKSVADPPSAPCTFPIIINPANPNVPPFSTSPLSPSATFARTCCKQTRPLQARRTRSDFRKKVPAEPSSSSHATRDDPSHTLEPCTVAALVNSADHTPTRKSHLLRDPAANLALFPWLHGFLLHLPVRPRTAAFAAPAAVQPHPTVPFVPWCETSIDAPTAFRPGRTRLSKPTQPIPSSTAHPGSGTIVNVAGRMIASGVISLPICKFSR